MPRRSRVGRAPLCRSGQSPSFSTARRFASAPFDAGSLRRDARAHEETRLGSAPTTCSRIEGCIDRARPPVHVRDMSTGKCYVIGAGIAGLSAAVSLATKGADVEVMEAAPQAGGRCRSWYDAQLGDVIDNGNHLVLSGNRATFSYLNTIGAAGRLSGPQEANFAFCDLQSGGRWTVSLGRGRLPTWLFAASRRVPDTSFPEYLRFARLLLANKGRAVDEVVRCNGAVWDKLLRPLLLAALNTAPERADAELVCTVLRETIARGGDASLPRIAFPNLAAVFIEPAVAFLRLRGMPIRFGERLRAIGTTHSIASSLEFGNTSVALSRADSVVLAVPPGGAAE